MNNPASKSNGITADTGLNFLDRFNSTAKTERPGSRSREDLMTEAKHSETENLVGPFALDAESLSWCWETGREGRGVAGGEPCVFCLSHF